MRPNNASTEGTKNAAIYRKAARLIEQGKANAACWAITGAATNGRRYLGSHPLREKFEEAILWDSPGSYGMWHEQENRDARVVALCFMAAMVEAGDA